MTFVIIVNKKNGDFLKIFLKVPLLPSKMAKKMKKYFPILRPADCPPTLFFYTFGGCVYGHLLGSIGESYSAWHQKLKQRPSF
jgi:hypothetical protein